MMAMQRLVQVCLAGALVLALPGAKAAGLVVWWEKGFYAQEDEAVQEIIAAFEQKTGKQVELVQPAHDEIVAKVEEVVAAGHPPDFLFAFPSVRHIARWAYEDRLVDLEDVLAPARDLFDADLIDISTLLDGKTGGHGLYALPMGRNSIHIHGRASWSALASRSRISRNGGRRSGRSGAIECSRPCADRLVATTSGGQGSPCPHRQETPTTIFCSSSSPMIPPG
jgi:ABC-type glycerol-3-phosphate transport system substrate-binding protein